jgi:two-component system response regulator DesR
LFKDTLADQLAIAIRRMMAGDRVVDPDWAPSTLDKEDDPLTGCERDVLRASLDGASIADIAM